MHGKANPNTKSSTTNTISTHIWPIDKNMTRGIILKHVCPHIIPTTNKIDNLMTHNQPIELLSQLTHVYKKTRHTSHILHRNWSNIVKFKHGNGDHLVWNEIKNAFRILNHILQIQKCHWDNLSNTLWAIAFMISKQHERHMMAIQAWNSTIRSTKSIPRNHSTMEQHGVMRSKHAQCKDKAQSPPYSCQITP